MIEYTIHIKLILEGPVLCHATAAGSPGIDSPMLRDSNGRFALPGSLIKGRLREAMAELGQRAGTVYKPDLDDLFGRQTGSKENAEPDILPYRGRLHIDDFLNNSRGRNEEMTRISIDPILGAARQKMLQVMEAPWSSGELVEFAGNCHFIVKDQSEGELIAKQVSTGLRWITGFGSNRSVGFGNVHKIEIEKTCLVDLLDDSGLLDLGEVDTFDLVIRPRGPFCLARHRVAENIFESEKIIPGSVIKGCLAEQWRNLLGEPVGRDVGQFNDPTRSELGANFDKVRITHAFPAHETSQTRPVVAPLSIVKVGKENFDVAMHRRPVLINSKAPAFQVDWKDGRDIDEAFGWRTKDSVLTTELRVRTSIDSTRRKAAEGQLFAYEMVIPQGFVWSARVDLTGIEDAATRGKVIRQLQLLLRPGLRGLGKTKVGADVSILPAHQNIPPRFASDPLPRADISQTSGNPEFWIVTLQTAAILCDPAELSESSRQKELRESYRKVWDQLSGGSLHLCHYFATQSLAGGFYLHRRFRAATDPDYYPFLLTNPGSVFVLKMQNESASELIESWLRHGLPLPDWAQMRFAPANTPGEHWNHCPYIRQNGFGEIAVNLRHSISEPKKGQCCEIKTLVD
jgi:CRISPR/Cas system CSM-associated protein Csm3 (group 7 of RAMP superfamily)